MAQNPVSFRWNAHFLDRLDEARGHMSRSAYVQRAIEVWMGLEGGNLWHDYHARRAVLSLAKRIEDEQESRSWERIRGS
jgi:hypothetical protein